MTFRSKVPDLSSRETPANPAPENLVRPIELKQEDMRQRTQRQPADPNILTVADVCGKLRMSRTWVIKTFENEPGVIILGSPKTTARARRLRILRIPIGVYNRVVNRVTKK
jgi:hypothetical protein